MKNLKLVTNKHKCKEETIHEHPKHAGYEIKRLYKHDPNVNVFDCELQSKNCCKNLTYQKSLCTSDNFSKSTGVWRYMNFLHTRTIFLLNFLKCIHNKTTLNVKILVCYFIHTLEAAIISTLTTWTELVMYAQFKFTYIPSSCM